MTELSPAAQEVMDAVHEIIAHTTIADSLAIAAALRAAAFQLREAYANETCIELADDWPDSIATELENAQ